MNLVQGSPEWFATRCGKATASKIADIISRTKSGWGAGRENYRAQLVAERLTGVVEPGFTNGAMQWGVDHEAQARAAYAFYRDLDVTEVGFVDHPTIANSGASPDGLVGDQGIVEIKCPNTKTHIQALRSGKVEGKYFTQICWQLACTGRDWADFVSYDPRMPEGLQLRVVRIERDEARIAELEALVAEFLAEVDAEVDALLKMRSDA